MESIVSRLHVRLKNLGLSLLAWDSRGRRLGPLEPGSELCRMLHEAGGPALDVGCEAACQALSQRAASLAECPCGGCVMVAPVVRRRRALGVVSACFPALDSLEDGSLERLCVRLGLSWSEVSDQARIHVRHSRAQARDLLDAFQWILELQEAADLARSETETLSTNLANTYEELSLLYRISGSMKVSQAPEEFLRDVCKDLLEVMSISAAAAVVFAHASTGHEDVVVEAGALGLDEAQIKALAAEQVAHKFINNRPMVDNDFRAPSELGINDAVKNLIAAPMLTDKSLMGMIIGFNKLDGDFDSVDLKLISSIANQASVFLSNNRLYLELQDLLMGVLHALTASIDAKDPYTSGHSSRVAVLSKLIAERLGYEQDKVQQIYLTGLLHDIGKIGVPERVLCKPGRLTEEEYELVKAHPSIGAKILGGIRQLDEIVGGILTHHERPDGKGYPQGLAGEQVPQEGLIVGLADAFDAMTSDRTYRTALPLEGVIGEIRNLSGAQFDPRVVRTFLEMDVSGLMEELRRPTSELFPIPSIAELNR